MRDPELMTINDCNIRSVVDNHNRRVIANRAAKSADLEARIRGFKDVLDVECNGSGEDKAGVRSAFMRHYPKQKH